ncbi:MAG: hypothetical protein MJK07_22120 [Flavobacteriales bacterium]|nr:hypothetical protein [Flavobacteriales bacterium]
MNNSKFFSYAVIVAGIIMIAYPFLKNDEVWSTRDNIHLALGAIVICTSTYKLIKLNKS